jgi:hypothetical protein
MFGTVASSVAHEWMRPGPFVDAVAHLRLLLWAGAGPGRDEASRFASISIKGGGTFLT